MLNVLATTLRKVIILYGQAPGIYAATYLTAVYLSI